MKISVTVSLVLLVSAAGDRYFALAFPFRYKNANTIRIAKILSVIIWTLSTLLNVFTVVYSGTMYLQPTIRNMSDFSESPDQHFVAVLLFVLFTLLWVFTFLTLWSLYKNYTKSLKLNRRIQTNIAPEKQMSIVLVVMVVAFTFTLLPTLYNHITFYVSKGNYLKNPDEVTIKTVIAVLFLSTNAIWNIVIYNVLNKKFRLAIIALFKKSK